MLKNRKIFNPSQKSPGFNQRDEWNCAFSAQEEAAGFSPRSFTFTFLFYFLVFGFCISFAQEPYVYDSGGRRDPFSPLVTPDGRLLQIETKFHSGDLRLEGIIFDKAGASYAIINGSVLAAGESVDDITVAKIMENKIIFEKGGKAFEQELNQGGQK